MILNYRKKPVIIEAIQFEGTEASNREIVNWMLGKTAVFIDKDYSTLKIPTLEGVMVASKGDYIIRGIKGEFYPCKPDIFEQTYELVNEK